MSSKYLDFIAKLKPISLNNKPQINAPSANIHPTKSSDNYITQKQFIKNKHKTITN